jgi:two-component system, cell cycle response regulator
LRVLVAEDARFARHLLQGALHGWGYQVVLAEDGEQAWRALQGPDPPSIALLDWMMPGLDGLEVCRKVRQAGREPYTYVILLTGRDRQEDVVAGLAAGADDYLRKPFDNLELEARIRTGRRIVELQAELIAAREALRQQATTDPLTGLANRRTILETLGRELERCRRSKAACAVVFVDLDHFKQVNDTHGHSAGDEVLRQTAATMRAVYTPTSSDPAVPTFMNVEVLRVDPAGRTISIWADGRESVLVVEGEGLTALSRLRPGDQVC